MQIELSQSRQLKYLNVYVVKDAISYDCFSNHHLPSCNILLLFQDTRWRS